MNGAGQSLRINSRPSLGGLARARGWLGGLKLEAVIAALLLCTFAAIHYQHALLDRTLVYSPSNSTTYSAYSYGDQGAGGTSTVTLDATHPLAWTCDLQPTYQYAFCGYGMLFDLQHDGHGLDLARRSPRGAGRPSVTSSRFPTGTPKACGSGSRR